MTFIPSLRIRRSVSPPPTFSCPQLAPTLISAWLFLPLLKQLCMFGRKSSLESDQLVKVPTPLDY